MSASHTPPAGIRLESDPNITVYPVSFKHLRRFHNSIARAVGELAKLRVPQGGDADALFRLALPMIADDLMDLLDECCSPPLSAGEFGSPHWVVAEAAEKWFQQSFGEAPKLRPWVSAIDTLAAAVTGQKTDLWQTLSGFFSQAATPAQTSSSAGDPAGLTADGASPSSVTTPLPQAVSKPSDE